MIANLCGHQADPQQAAEVAGRVLVEYGLDCIGAALPWVAMDLALFIQEGPMNGADARLVANGDKGIATVRASIPNESRRKFAGCHELGHWVLHREMQSQWLCTEADLAGYSKSPREVEANAFAAELQIPQALLRKSYAGPVTMDLAEQVRRDLGTSLTAALRRLVEALEDDCIMLMVENSQVRYYVQSRGWRGPTIKAKHRPECCSVVNQVRFCKDRPQGATPSFARGTVTTDVWSHEGDSVNQLIEQAEVLYEDHSCPTLVLLRPVPPRR